MRFVNDMGLGYNDVTLVPVKSNNNSRSDGNIGSAGYRNPIINSPMIHTSSHKMLKYFYENNMLTTVHRYFKSAYDQINHCKIALGDDFHKIYYAVGKDIEWINILVDHGITSFVIDMAHGWSMHCINIINYIHKVCPNSFIIAGNVDSYEGAKELLLEGADGIRVGIASGAICSTCINTGFGTPMITALQECRRAVDEYSIPKIIIADGGISTGGTIAKCMAFADFVMIGSLLGSTDLAEGPFYDKNKELTETDPYYVEFFGMASTKAREYNGSHTKNVSVEGVSGLYRYKGKTEDVILGLEDNMRASLSYAGSKNWRQYRNNVVMMRITHSGYVEKLTHLDIHD